MSETTRQNQESKDLIKQLQSQHTPISKEEWEKLKRKHDPEWTEEQLKYAKKLEDQNAASTDEINW